MADDTSGVLSRASWSILSTRKLSGAAAVVGSGAVSLDTAVGGEQSGLDWPTCLHVCLATPGRELLSLNGSK